MVMFNVYMRVGVARALDDSSDFGLLWEQSSQKLEIPCFGRWWTAMQNVTPLALSSAEKPVTGQMNRPMLFYSHTNTQSNDNQYIQTVPIGMCG